jgi:hypothetical protein
MNSRIAKNAPCAFHHRNISRITSHSAMVASLSKSLRAKACEKRLEANRSQTPKRPSAQRQQQTLNDFDGRGT